MNAAQYSDKQAARIARLHSRAAAKAKEAEALHGKVRKSCDMIPLGQPILVGHHSERRASRDQDRIHSGMGKALAASREAESLARRAKAAEANTTISSDDPNAVALLGAKLSALEVEHMAAKKSGEHGWALTNRAAQIRAVKARIALLEKKALAPARTPEQFGSITVSEADNRCRITFPGKPAPAVIASLKANGFRWSPSASAWQRMASEGAWYHARRIAGEASAP